MFHLLSKTIGMLIRPENLALTLCLLALMLRLLKSASRLRRWLVIFAVAELVLLSMGIVSNALIAPLESAFPKPKGRMAAPGAIITLSGFVDTNRIQSDYDFSDGTDRFIETLRLAKRYPHATILFSGGSGSLRQDRMREADLLARVAMDIGIPRERLRIEAKSRNTYENAVESRSLLNDLNKPYWLVTSAAHMPRAVACFKKQGIRVIPWPTDFQEKPLTWQSWIPNAAFLRQSESALHEYVGLLFYWLAGYTR